MECLNNIYERCAFLRLLLIARPYGTELFLCVFLPIECPYGTEFALLWFNWNCFTKSLIMFQQINWGNEKSFRY